MVDDQDGVSVLHGDVVKAAGRATDSARWPLQPGDLLADVANVEGCSAPTLSVYAELSPEGKRSLRIEMEPVAPAEDVGTAAFVVDDIGRLHELMTGLLDGWNWLRGQGS